MDGAAGDREHLPHRRAEGKCQPFRGSASKRRERASFVLMDGSRERTSFIFLFSSDLRTKWMESKKCRCISHRRWVAHPKRKDRERVPAVCSAGCDRPILLQHFTMEIGERRIDEMDNKSPARPQQEDCEAQNISKESGISVSSTLIVFAVVQRCNCFHCFSTYSFCV